jgi:imidazole glycerol-phosphate synthase subunit HisH
MKVVIIDYGAGNIFSMKATIERLGVVPILSLNKEEILSADRVIFPGVGHADFAMRSLKQSGLDLLIPKLNQAVMGVCLGMQLMCKHSKEGNVSGLNIFEDVSVLKFKDVPTIPHMGWNNLENTSGLLDNMNEDVYFVHSYYVQKNQYSIAETNYGNSFTAAMQNKNFFACQFHPEKSGKTGEEIIKRFLNQKI